jgi:prepilin-type processing-associated H-X9-DG protein
MQCVNNLKQIGLGLHNYHSTNDSFPLGSILAHLTATTYGGNKWSPHAQLLAYMEQMAVYNAINFSWAPQGGGATGLPTLIHSTVQRTQVNSFLCPSDGQINGVNGHTNYHGSTGTTTQPGAQTTTGLFQHDSAKHNARPVGMNAMTDGSSNTVAFSEALIGAGQWSNIMYRNDIDGASIPTTAIVQDAWSNYQGVLAALNTCTALVNSKKSSRPATNNRGAVWTHGNDGLTLFNTIVPPNAQQYQWGACKNGATYAGNSQFANANSNHPGGANVLFVDGSVHFIKTSINMQTYWKLGTRADGEVISANSY